MIARQTSKRRHAPGAGVADRFIEYDGIVKFHQLTAPRRTAAADERDVLGAFVAMNEQSVLRLTDIAFFTGNGLRR